MFCIIIIINTANVLTQQMRIIHGSGYSEADRRAATALIISNVHTSITAMLAAMRAMGISLQDPELHVRTMSRCVLIVE